MRHARAVVVAVFLVVMLAGPVAAQFRRPYTPETNLALVLAGLLVVMVCILALAKPRLR